jgi:NADH-quinone oxidoreductase subunit N
MRCLKKRILLTCFPDNMNALIFSAISGVVMMFAGVLVKQKSTIRVLAHVLLLLVLIVTFMELRGITLLQVNTQGMMAFDRFALLFTAIAAFSTFVFFLLSSPDMERVGVHYSDYFALIFLC